MMGSGWSVLQSSDVQKASKESGRLLSDMSGCQNYGPFLGPQYSTAPNILGYPKRDHNFDNHPYEHARQPVYYLSPAPQQAASRSGACIGESEVMLSVLT